MVNSLLTFHSGFWAKRKLFIFIIFSSFWKKNISENCTNFIKSFSKHCSKKRKEKEKHLAIQNGIMNKTHTVFSIGFSCLGIGARIDLATSLHLSLDIFAAYISYEPGSKNNESTVSEKKVYAQNACHL